ncbi:hypothetical protein, partial [Acetobacter senegalensis]|uniref:hypothetical protein n=1 Tax=Acetobacter senegalensis TaxID=446692 RepID=UPI00264CD585
VFRTMTLQKRVFTAYRQRRKPQLKNGIRITFQTAEKATSAENSRFPNHDTAKKGLHSIPATPKTAVAKRCLNHLSPQNKPKTAENLTIRP